MVCAICGGPTYSKSVEHEHAELCFRDFKAWLRNGKDLDKLLQETAPKVEGKK